MGKRKIWIYEEVKEYVNKLEYELISKEYKNNKEKLILRDNEGYYYMITFSNLLNKCIPKRFHKSNPYTIQNINLWCKLNNKPFKLVSEKYIDAKDNLIWKCLKDGCGEEFEANWNYIHAGYGCGFCSGHQVGISNCLATKNPELAKEWHPILNGELTPYDITCGTPQYAWWICEKGHEWYANISHRTDGNGCPYCSGRYATKENNLLKDNPKLCKEWDYNKNDKNPEDYTPGSSQYAWWKCKECNYSWYARIKSRNGKLKTGCPECNKSKGENKINEVLIENNWVKMSQEEFDKLEDNNKYNKNYFIPQKEFDGLIGLGNKNLSYDHYIPKYNLLIEYHGGQHEKFTRGIHKTIKDFEKQLEHDNRKCIYAQNHNINLLIIWYWDFDKIEEILDKALKN